MVRRSERGIRPNFCVSTVTGPCPTCSPYTAGVILILALEFLSFLARSRQTLGAVC